MSATGVSNATDRITLRRRHGRRRRWVIAGIALGVLAVLGALAWLLLGSDAFGVRTVAVQGNTIVATDDVRRLAEVPAGTPLARVDVNAVATRVSGLPAVARVSVARVWPHTISIQVTERTPMFAIETTGGYWIVDDAGVVFQSAAVPPPGLMVASVPGGDPRLVRDLATVLRALPAPLRSRLDQVGAATADSITLELANGTTIIWGSAEQSELKAQVLVKLMERKHRIYDVSAPSSPVTR